MMRMKKEVEIEFKNMVTTEQFKQLLQFFTIEDQQFFIQSNEYFDTADYLLKKKNSALRIREKNEQFELTLKTPAPVGLYEYNQMISATEVEEIRTKQLFPNGIVKSELEHLQLPLSQLQSFGKIVTKRAETNYKDGILVFDHSYYLDHEDYEIEYEVNDYDTGKVIFHQLLKQLNIPAQKADNKIARLFNRRFR